MNKIGKIGKGEVYRWRLSTKLKRELEAAAEDEGTSVESILDRVMQEWLDKRPRKLNEDEDAEEQHRLRERLMKVIGTAAIGLGPYTNERVREIMGERLEQKQRASQERAPRRSR